MPVRAKLPPTVYIVGLNQASIHVARGLCDAIAPVPGEVYIPALGEVMRLMLPC